MLGVLQCSGGAAVVGGCIFIVVPTSRCDFAAQVGLGALGVVAELTLQCVPAHDLLEHTYTASREWCVAATVAICTSVNKLDPKYQATPSSCSCSVTQPVKLLCGSTGGNGAWYHRTPELLWLQRFSNIPSCARWRSLVVLA